MREKADVETAKNRTRKREKGWGAKREKKESE